MQRLKSSLRIGFVLTFAAAGLSAESLRYNLKWPSGLSLGEAALDSSGLTFSLGLDASLPGYPIRDHYTSSTTAQFCTIRFERETLHGSKKANERIVVASDGSIKRETVGGGSALVNAGPCAHDPVSLLFATRLGLQAVKVPPAQTVLYGTGYPVRFEMGGYETVTSNDRTVQADKITCVITLPKTGDYRLEMFFLRDPARTPVLLRAPFAIGTFSMELVR